ncbi:transmembrane 14C [Brachionus plicatilis]|uniref:Transmembrane 14C n=1 Tax=Brachionus plicatilis TaxID=10195 RepID=A0A3M7SLT2_BRAPC|nr:transmembrane 14C [Brachionus plicatilis]
MSQNVSRTDFLSYGYGLAIVAGGLIGYLKANSIPSLAAGLAFGAAATYGAVLTSQDPKRFHLGLVTSTLLLGVMGMRFWRTGKLMPAGLMAALSLAQTARLGMRVSN